MLEPGRAPEPDAEARGSLDRGTVDGFGFEWSVYDQTGRDPESLRRTFDRYTAGLDWDALPADALALDVGCGTGRWAALLGGRGAHVVGLDAAAPALAVAARRLPSGRLVQGSAVELPLRDACVDLAVSLGVLHHLPDTQAAMAEVHRVLRPGAPFLVYLYYAFDNRPAWFRSLWQVSDAVRRFVAARGERTRLAVTTAIAATVYWPLSRVARVLERRGRDVSAVPLSAYRDQPWYVLRTDALDRFGTRLEQRFTRSEIDSMLRGAGFSEVAFNEDWPFWCAVARA